MLSPSTSQMDRVDKLPIYASHGVAYAWLLDPGLETLEIFVLQDRYWRLGRAYKGADEVCAPPSEALTFSLASFWV